MSKMIDAVVKECDQCQQNKITGSKNYGKVPPTDDKGVPSWDTVHVVLAGPWTVDFKLTDNEKILTKQVQCFTAIDKATGWPEIMGIDNKRSESIVTLFENEWISRYP